MIGVAVLVLLGAIAVFAFGLPPETTGVDQERTVEETIAVSEQFAGEPNVGLAPLAEEATTFSIQGYVTVDAYHFDAATGTYVLFYHDESSNIITIIGKDWIAEQLGGNAASTTTAQWITLSVDTTDPPNTWGQLANATDDASTEITTGGLARAGGSTAYDHTTGQNTYTIEWTFTATAGHTAVQLTGLQWSSTGGTDNNLLAANTFTPVTLATDDTLTVTWTITLS